ncbi:hypothetical protein [Spongiactinospora sp. 9N601]|uniref:hypothetical protein n=1 Tax=Spongiactinospora sp. 9N601 TaxID=3375149 RepID=UPI0037B67E13
MTQATIRPGSCTLCEAMCGLRITVSGDRVIDIRGDEDDRLSAGHICPRALALAGVRNDPDRLRPPVRRTAGGRPEITWDEAFGLVSGELARIGRTHGAGAVATCLGNPVTHGLGAMTHAPPFVALPGTRNRFSAGPVDRSPPRFAPRPLMGRRRVLFGPRRTETARLGAEHHSIRPGTAAARYGRMGVSTLCRWGVQLLNIRTGDLDRPGGTLFTRPAADPIRTGERGPLTVEPERSPAEGTGR